MLVRGVSFAVRRGEVLGIAGLMGAGRSDLLMAIFGAHTGPTTGEILIDGKLARIARPWRRAKDPALNLQSLLKQATHMRIPKSVLSPLQRAS